MQASHFKTPLLAVSLVLLFQVGACHEAGSHSKGTSPSNTSMARYLEAAKIAAEPYGAVMVTIADQRALRVYLPSLLASLDLSSKSKETANALLLFVESEADLETCKLLHSSCFLDDLMSLPSVPVPENATLPKWQSREFAWLSWRRVDLVNAIMQAGMGVFLIDLDSIFYNSPFMLLQNPEYADLDFFALTESGNNVEDLVTGKVNMGFTYFAPTEPGRQLVSEWVKIRSVWDQEALQMLLRDKSIPGLKWLTLPRETAYSLCLPRLGPNVNASDETLHQGHKLFHARYYEHLVEYVEHYKALTVFHFPCCSHPSRELCKTFLMGLAMLARID